MLKPEPIVNPDYYLDHYGTCKLGAACLCLKNGWIGRQCIQWIPLGVTSFEELAAYVRKRGVAN